MDGREVKGIKERPQDDGEGDEVERERGMRN